MAGVAELGLRAASRSDADGGHYSGIANREIANVFAKTLIAELSVQKKLQ